MSNDIAIIGMNLRLPGAPHPEAFWQMLREGKSGISFFEDAALLEMGHSAEDLRQENFVRAGGVIENVFDWDAAFFGLSPKAAAIMDPQQRLLLECTWQMLEKAGYAPDQVPGITGAFISVANNQYNWAFRQQARPAERYLAFTSNDPDFAATRLSYHFNWSGPSINVQTACSSALVAVHMGCESLLNHECDTAITGGVSLFFPQAGYLYDSSLMFSPDGVCRPFDQKAQGTVFSNGLGLMMLKRLEDALNDGDQIHAVIKGSAVNNDGGAKNNFFAPSPLRQKEVLLDAWEIAQISPASLGYIETHGTATPLGDPVEFQALREAFRTHSVEQHTCYLGAVKSNIGHTNTVAGIAGLLKAVLSLQNQQIPGTLHYQAPNPEIPLADSPFRINASLQEWPKSEAPRRAGVSAFGIGGTNVHVVLEEAPAMEGRNQRTPLPPYAFNRKTHKLPKRFEHGPGGENPHPTPIHPYLRSISNQNEFAIEVPSTDPLLQGHQWQGQSLLPAAAYIELLWSGLRILKGETEPFLLEELSFLRPWSAEKGSLYLRFRPGGEKYEVSFFSKEAEERLYARGILRQEIAPSLPDLSPWLSKPVKQTVSGETLYEFIHQTGFRYGEDYQLLEQLNLSDDQVIASFSLKEQTQRKDDFKVHPILLDAAFQAVIPLLTSFQKQDIAFVPYLMEELRFFQSPGNQGQVLVRKIASASSQRVAVFDLYLLNGVGELCLWLHRLHLVPLSQEEKEVNTQHQVPQLKSDNPIVQSLIKVFAESLGYAEAELDPQQALNHYGLDSILISGVMEKLEVYYPNLPKTLLFEYSTIGEIANFISQNIAPPTLTDMTMPEATPQARPEQPFIRDIAVIGMHGRYPEAEDLNQFWQNLKDGKDCIVEIPEERWPLDGFFDADPNRMGYSYSKWGGYVKEAEYFDPLFFKISPKDAGGIDPQERIFLESVWCAIENAGYRPDNLGSSSRKVGVFVGIMWALYQMHNSEQRALGNLVEANSSYWSVPNRVSYHFNFQGPSIAVDTACSSSLTSIHMACISLLSGESQVAIAGGVNLTLHPYKYYLLSGRFFAAKDGRCRSFGKGGSGYVPGEGVGSLVLKTLEKAQADGDHIYAVIKASSVNHGGKVNGFTVPNPNAQAVVVGDTLDKAGISPAAISYIETHGTGTELGDPIEIAGLNKVMNQGEIPQQSCAIGSVKSNIGHLEASAGIAGVHKVILQMLHKQLVPSLHSRELNPNIDFGNSPFQVQQHLADWPLPNHYPKRLAGVSSFGAGGSNAHVIVEEYEMPVSVAKDPGTQLIILSARDEKRLTATAAQLLEFLQQPEQLVPVNLADLAFTLQVGRTQFDYRLAFVAESLAAVKMRLQEFVQGDFQHLEKGKRAKGIRKMDPAESQRMLQNGEQWKLGQMWCEGVRINWDQLNENATARRIPLPNSLFAKKRYWLPQVGTIPVNGHTQAVSTLTAATETEKTISQPSKPKPDPLSELQYFAVQLREKPIPQSLQSRATQGIFISQKSYLFAEGNHFYPQEPSIIDQPGQGVWELSNETAVHDILLDAEMLWQEGGTSPAQDYLLAFYQQLKSWLPDHKRKINLIVFFQTQDPRKLPAFRATGSMFKVLKKEFPSSLFRLVEFQEDSVVSLPKLVAELNLGQSAKTEAVYRAGKRFEYRIEPAEPHSSTLAGAGNGPVLITGGAGAMGLCFAESLLQESENKVILTGRKAFEMLPEPVRLKIKRWGERASYFQSDVSNPASLSRLGDQIKAQFGALGGIVHSAGLVRDAMFKNKSEEVFASVLMPKVQGSQNLEALVQRFRPAWVMLCSSIGALEGQMGQSDYACANRFMDEWVKQKSSSATQYHSVNWPYWQEGGMQLPPHFVAAMEKAGIKGISNEEGKAAFRAALQAQETQTILFKGSADGTATFFPDLKEKPAATQAAPVKLEIEFTGDDPAEWVKQYLAHLLAENTSIDIAEIEYDAEMEDFGIDSIVVMKMLDALELVFPDIPRSIFFEYRTIGDLSDHLAAAFPEQAAALGKGAPMKPAEANASLPTAAETSAPNTALPPENASPVPPSSSPQPIPDTSNPGPSSPIRFTPEEVKTFLVNTLAEATSLTPDEIDPEAELEDYGLDSVVITQLTEKLELKFGEIPKTLFFEYHTLEDLAAAIAEVARGPADPDAATTYFQVIQELNPGRKFQLDLQTEAPLINGHVVADALLFPGAGYMALVSALYPGRLNYFQNVSWTAPLYPEKLSAPVQLEFSPSGGLDKFSVSAGTQHFASGKTGVKDATYAENLSLMDIAGPDWETISGTEVYQWFRQHRFQYGEAYRLIQEIKVGQGQCLGRLRLSHLPAKGLAPNALDNAFQCLIGLTIKAEQETDSIWVPFLLEEAWVYESHWPEELWVWVQYQPTTRQSSIRKFNLTLVDANGRHLMFCKNFSIKAFAQPTVSTNGHGQEPAKAERKLPAIRSYEELLDLLQRQEISAEEAVELEKTYLL